MDNSYENVDEYIGSFPEKTRILLEQIRSIIRRVAMEAEESISFGMPAYKLKNKPLVYFGAHKNHIGFYPTALGNAAFDKELATYKHGKGSVQFPMNKPLPLDLIEKMVKFRLEENR